MKRQISLRLRVAAAIGGMILILLVSVFISAGLQVRKSVHDLVVSSNLQIAEARADEIDAIIEMYQQQLRILSIQDTIVYGTDREAEEFAHSMIGEVGSDIVNVYIAWPDGRGTSGVGTYINVGDRAYFSAIFTEKLDRFVGNPIISRNTGEPAIILAQAVYYPDGRIRAILGFEMSLEQISKSIDEINVGDQTYGWVIDSSGLVIAAQDPDIRMKLNINTADEDFGYTGLSELSKTALTELMSEGSFIRPDGKKYSLFTTEVSEVYNWHLSIAVSDAEVNKPVNDLNKMLFFIMAGALVVFLIIAMVIGNWIAEPIKKVGAHFRELAEGEADLTKRLDIKRNDEIGKLVTDFNEFLAKLAGIIAEMKGAQDQIMASSQQLTTEAQGATGEITRISDLVDIIQERLQRQNADIENSSAAVKQTSNGITRLDELITDQSASVTEASASIEEMVGNIGSVSASTDRIATEFKLLLASSDQGLAVQNAAGVSIAQIAEQSESLLEANEIIGSIASQTNLLAMNAAIEAAHAGDAGKGFSVVADEIRRLAETSAEQTRTIGTKLQSIRETIETIVKASTESEKAFEDLSGKIGTTDMLVTEVKAAMIEQREGSEQILEAIKSMNDITSKVRASSGEMSSGNEVIVSAMEKLSDAARGIFESSKDIGTAITSVEGMAQEITTITSQNEQLVERMEGTIGRFKV
ncbi:methyl-accepting chemotaxis protein [Brucepastera parasyntrophica]|uniref:methyl-accepting chemotaxis protein n=1 Tax=Brucepastera parasyntrophica TaxID=2880008 RepID=UPI00210D6B79|nr:methyl-accepting chemotaxis protein [Brucepastera parasyntrophica]ULQ59135.1 methyl-accepting chemotaxis protein [Brucepastera parasyntrophica]